MKRFWTDVAVDTDRGVTLDGRPVRTPGRTPLVLPTPALAEAVAAEWRAVPETLDPRAMPLTGLANAAIDRIAAAPAAFAAGLAAYARATFSTIAPNRPMISSRGSVRRGIRGSTGHADATTFISSRPPASSTVRSRRRRWRGSAKRSRRRMRSTSPAFRRW